MQDNLSKNVHAQAIDGVLKALEATEHGLSASEVTKRLNYFGNNSLPITKNTHPFCVLLCSFIIRLFIYCLRLGWSRFY